MSFQSKWIGVDDALGGYVMIYINPKKSLNLNLSELALKMHYVVMEWSTLILKKPLYLSNSTICSDHGHVSYSVCH